jgi:hypothetical protein
MILFTEELLTIVEEEISNLRNCCSSQIQHAEACVQLLADSLNKLHHRCKEKGFISQQAEITFFRTTKPKLLSLLYYYHSVYCILVRMPEGRQGKRYLKHELKKIETFFRKHQKFYEYYRSRNTHLDSLFFTPSTFMVRS